MGYIVELLSFDCLHSNEVKAEWQEDPKWKGKT